MWILTNPQHFLTTFTWDTLNVNADRMKQSLNNTKPCLNYAFLLEQQKDYRDGRNLAHKQWRGPYDIEGHAQKCVERYSELVNMKVKHFYKVSRPCLDDHQFKQEELELNLLENCQRFARKLSWNTWTWHELDYLRHLVVSKQACKISSQNGPTHVTNDWQGWFPFFITRMTIVNIVMSETRHSTADWVCSKTQTFAGDLEDSKSTSGEVLCILGSRTFVPVSWMCKKRTSVSHSSTESQVLPLDAGLRMVGLPPLDLWDIVIEVSHSTEDHIQPKHSSHQETGAVLDSKNQDSTCHKKTEGWPIEWRGSRTHQHTFYSIRVSAVHFWRQRSCDQDDN